MSSKTEYSLPNLSENKRTKEEECLLFFMENFNFEYCKINEDGTIDFYCNNEPFSKEEFSPGSTTWIMYNAMEEIFSKDKNEYNNKATQSIANH